MEGCNKTGDYQMYRKFKNGCSKIEVITNILRMKINEKDFFLDFIKKCRKGLKRTCST
jgi:hypothetical protein